MKTAGIIIGTTLTFFAATAFAGADDAVSPPSAGTGHHVRRIERHDSRSDNHRQLDRLIILQDRAARTRELLRQQAPESAPANLNDPRSDVVRTQ